MQYLKTMGKQVKRIVLMLAVCSVLSLAMLTMSAPSQKSYAQTPCTAPGAGAGFSLSTVWSAVESAAISAAQSAITAYQAALMAIVENAMQSIMQIFQDQFTEWLDTFWAHDLRPAMADMTAQLNTADITTSRFVLSAYDGVEVNQTIRAKDVVEMDAVREHEVGELRCIASSLNSGLQRQSTLKRAYARAAPIERITETGAVVGTPAAEGEGQYQFAKLQTYCNRYVDVNSNNGVSPCPGPPPAGFVNEDIDASKLFVDTYDVTDPQLRTNMDDFVKNAVGIRPVPIIGMNEFEGKRGQEEFMETQEYLAKQQLAYSGMYRVVSCIVPGSGMDTIVAAHRNRSGVPNISTNPSWCELERAVLESSSEDLQNKLSSESPENVDRFLAALDIYQLTFGMGEISDLMDYTSTIHATQAAHELEQTATYNKVSGAKQ